MKQKEIIIQNGGTKFFLGSNLSIRSLLKHVITFTYMAMVMFVLFQTPLDLTNLTMEHLKKMVVVVVIILFLTRSTIASLKMLNQSFKSFIVTTVFIFGMMAGSLTLVIIKLDSTIGEWKELTNLIIIYAGVPAYVGVWKLTVAVMEVNSSPFLSKKLIFKGISHFVSSGYILLVMYFMRETYLAPVKKPIDPWNYLHMTYMLSIAGLFILYIFLSFYGWKKYGKVVTKTWHIKAISLSLGIVLVVPLAVWLPFKSYLFRSEWHFILFISIDVVLVALVLFYSFIRKTEMGSPKIYVILVTISITMIWGLKFFYHYQFGYDIPQDFTLTTSLLATALILLIQYLKSPNIGKGVSMIYRFFSVTLFILSLALWLSLHFTKEMEAIKTIVDIPELINVFLLVLPAALALTSILSWAVTMRTIKKYSKINKYQLGKKKNKKEQKVNLTKEAINA